MVMAEETDDLDTKEARFATSHFELYCEAMKEVGADPSVIQAYVTKTRAGTPWRQSLDEIKAIGGGVPASTIEFSRHTLELATTGQTHEIASAFLYGREDPIPKMFTQFLATLESGTIIAPNFKKYLERHIYLDADYHRPMAEKLLLNLIIGDEPTGVETRFQEAFDAATSSIQSRINLWEGIYK